MPAKITKPAAIAHGLGPLMVVVLFLVFAQWTGNPQSSSAAAAWVMMQSIGLPVLWLFAAFGLGLPLRMLLARNSPNGLALQAALGLTAMMWLDETLGALGLLQRGGSIGGWLLIVVGIALLGIQLLSAWKRRPDYSTPSWLIWAASPSIAVLLLAACSAPGWLWSSEFGGYDALSYHLQLPKEWFSLGRIEPLHHNVYSYLPGYVEAAYYHLFVLQGGAIDAVYSCQFLHAGLTIISAVLIGGAATRIIASMQSVENTQSTAAMFGGTIAGVVALGTPWVIVVGSLAYNEMAVVLMLAAGVVVLTDDSITGGRRGLLIGAIGAAACAAKLTGFGMVAVPLGLLILTSTPRRSWFKCIGFAVAAGLLVLFPYLLRNWISSGNPLFPFATGIFGLGHWTAEQATAFAHGHRSDASLSQRMVELWNQFLRYGIGLNPDIREPWKPQWAILLWVGIAGLLIGAFKRSTHIWSIRLLLVLFAQIIFWMFFTHLKSRFMLPAIVPLSIGVAIGASIILKPFRQSRLMSIATAAVITLLLLAWSCLPVLVFRSERDVSPAAGIDLVRYFTGDGVSRAEREEWAATFPMVLINHLLPADAKVLMIGDATPLYANDQSRITYQTTWDRGPLSQIIREHPDDPSAWSRSLREQGIEFVLMNPEMLDIWERAGWNDPLITAARIMQLTKPPSRLVRQFPNGEILIRLE